MAYLRLMEGPGVFPCRKECVQGSAMCSHPGVCCYRRQVFSEAGARSAVHHIDEAIVTQILTISTQY